MNLLHNLPNTLRIHGQEVSIKTDFRVWLSLLNSMRKSGGDEQLLYALKSVFMEFAVTQNNYQECIIAVSRFLDDAKSYTNADYKEPVKRHHAEENTPYDIELDSNYIFSAFMEQYGIDLVESELHYYKFIALFDCLKSETLFKSIVYHRTKDLSKIKEREAKKDAQRLKDIFALPKGIHLSPFEQEIRTQQIQEFNATWSLSL